MRRSLFDLHAGEAFGRYELLLPVAKGGMSRVWAARLRGTRGFQKLVAIKTLIAQDAQHALLERMLLDEAQLASQIQHPNVAQYLDLGERDGVLYVVMEWIDGEALSSVMRHAAKVEPIPRHIAVELVTQACKGLHGAHELRDAVGQPLGLVHCDVSPQNIMIAASGAVKLIDFGIARATRDVRGVEDPSRVAGKLAFMAPEQARGERVDRRADVFSLGIMLYLLSTGRHPFSGKTSAETLQRICSNEPVARPRVLDASYPKALERVVMRALAHKREARFDSAAEMLYELTAALPERAHEPDIAEFLQRVCARPIRERRDAIADALRFAEANSTRRLASTRAPSLANASELPPALARLRDSVRRAPLISTEAPLEADAAPVAFRPRYGPRFSWLVPPFAVAVAIGAWFAGRSTVSPEPSLPTEAPALAAEPPRAPQHSAPSAALQAPAVPSAAAESLGGGSVPPIAAAPAATRPSQGGTSKTCKPDEDTCSSSSGQARPSSRAPRMPLVNSVRLARRYGI